MRSASWAGMNQGVVASIFSTSIIFSSLLFFIFYNEKLIFRDLIGMLLMTVSVVFIGTGGGNVNPDEQNEHIHDPEKQDSQSFYAIMYAVLVGFSMAANSLAMRFFMNKVELTAAQMSNDSAFLAAFLLLGLFIKEVRAHNPYVFLDMFMASMASILSTMAAGALGKAIETGLGGPVQAITNLMSLVQMILVIIFMGQMPNLLQILGICIGLAGAFVISNGDEIFFKKQVR